MPNFVRVKDKATKHEYSVVESAFDSEAHDLLRGKDAVGPDGTPLAPKHHVSLSNQSGHKAEPKKES